MVTISSVINHFSGSIITFLISLSQFGETLKYIFSDFHIICQFKSGISIDSECCHCDKFQIEWFIDQSVCTIVVSTSPSSM
jgi:hypothetical protein